MSEPVRLESGEWRRIADGPPLRVLVVDDDEVDRMAVRRALRSAGIPVEIVEAHSQPEALDRLRQGEFDCVFLDYHLPGGDGMKVLRSARDSGSDTPMVMLTGHGDEQTAVELMKAGAADYVAKGAMTPERLAQSLRHAVALHRAERQAREAHEQLEATNARLRRANEELVRQRNEADRARQAADEANLAKSQFLAMMSHDLRTPLNAIAGYAQLIELGVHGPVTDAQREALGRITRAQTHLLSLINDILNFAKVEAGTIRYDIRSVPVDETLSGLGGLIDPQIRERTLLYEYRGGDRQVRVMADRERMLQVLLNLLTNAVKFTEPGGRIRVEWTAEDATVAIRVSDTGKGIPPEQLQQIFEPFVQLGRQREAGEGIGLGLAISRELARAMGGDLVAESVVGAGSAFTLILPRGASATPSGE